MFKKLKNELILTFDLKTESPLYIKAGEDNALDPSATDGRYISTYRNGISEPFIPGTSLKGVFRSRAERLLSDSCDIVGGDECVLERRAKDDKLNGVERYKRSCPVCRLFGSKVLKSRITFSDSFVSGNYTVGERTCVGIDRITGATKRGALYNMLYVEDAVFKGKITIQNYERYQLKLILILFKEMEQGFITVGGMTSKGFGFLKGENFVLKVKSYDKNSNLNQYERKDYYFEKNVEGFDNIMKLVENIDIIHLRRDGDIDEQTL